MSSSSPHASLNSLDVVPPSDDNPPSIIDSSNSQKHPHGAHTPLSTLDTRSQSTPAPLNPPSQSIPPPSSLITHPQNSPPSAQTSSHLAVPTTDSSKTAALTSNEM